MRAQRGSFAVAAFLFMVVPGCTCPWGSCGTSEGNADRREMARDSILSAESAPHGGQAPTAIAQNLSDVEILVGEIEPGEGEGYVLKGTIVSASPAGGAVSIAETGQNVALTPFYPGGTPDLSLPAHRRLAELRAAPRGSKIRCRITLDGRGSWRIVSAG